MIVSPRPTKAGGGHFGRQSAGEMSRELGTRGETALIAVGAAVVMTPQALQS